MHCYKKTSIAVAISLLAGCAVSPKDISDMRDKKTVTSEAQMARAAIQQKQESSLTKINGNYLGDMPIDLPYAATLPTVFFEPISIHSRGSSFGTVAQAAKNIGLATGIPVRVNPDVEAVIPGAITQAQATAGINLNAPINSNPGIASHTTVNNKQVVKLDFQGPLLSYIKMVANSGGVEWEYRDGSINFFRLVTKSFMLSNATPGDVEVADSLSKGGNATTGQAGGLTANSSGSLTSASSVGMKGSYSIWTAIKPSLEGALSPGGKLSINQATGSITVTDIKDAVARVEKIVERENAILGRQVSIEVRIIRVNVNDATQAGINLGAVYSLFNNSGSVINSTTVAPPSSLATAASGSMTFAVSNPLSPFNGTNLAVQGLNSFGTIASDTVTPLVTTNRVPTMTGTYSTQGYLASTTPAAGGATAGGQGVPGLTPGSTTVGSFLRILPTIRDNNTVLLNLSVDISDLLGFGSASTGAGATLQQIQWANTDGTKTAANLLLNQDEAMVMVGIGAEGVNSNAGIGVGGASANANKRKSLFVVIVTPRILKGI